MAKLHYDILHDWLQPSRTAVADRILAFHLTVANCACVLTCVDLCFLKGKQPKFLRLGSRPIGVRHSRIIKHNTLTSVGYSQAKKKKKKKKKKIIHIGCGPINAYSAHSAHDSNDRFDSLVYLKCADNHFV